MTTIRDYLKAIEETESPLRLTEILGECAEFHPEWYEEVKSAYRQRRLEIPDYISSHLNAQFRTGAPRVAEHTLGRYEVHAINLFGERAPEIADRGGQWR